MSKTSNGGVSSRVPCAIEPAALEEPADHLCRSHRTLGRPGVAASRCRLPSAGAGSDRERDPGQLFRDCPQAALDGGVAGLTAGVGQFRVAPGPEESARAVVLAAGSM